MKKFRDRDAIEKRYIYNNSEGVYKTVIVDYRLITGWFTSKKHKLKLFKSGHKPWRCEGETFHTFRNNSLPF